MDSLYTKYDDMESAARGIERVRLEFKEAINNGDGTVDALHMDFFLGNAEGAIQRALNKESEYNKVSRGNMIYYVQTGSYDQESLRSLASISDAELLRRSEYTVNRDTGELVTSRIPIQSLIDMFLGV